MLGIQNSLSKSKLIRMMLWCWNFQKNKQRVSQKVFRLCIIVILFLIFWWVWKTVHFKASLKESITETRPSSYSALNAYSVVTKNGIKVALPARSVVYLVIYKKCHNGYAYTKHWYFSILRNMWHLYFIKQWTIFYSYYFGLFIILFTAFLHLPLSRIFFKRN